MAQFDAKTFNPTVFGRYVERVPDLVRTELLKSGALVADQELANMLPAQSGGNYITVPLKGLIGGDALNYDGETDLTTTSTKTYTQSHIVIGRMKGWEEKQFSKEITGIDFMDNVAQQVAGYKEKLDQKTLLAILKGIFNMPTTNDGGFVAAHTYDISAKTDGFADATTMNSAIQKATGDNAGVFSFAIMHSAVATNLKNLQILEYLKYTDANGIQRDLQLATYNGITVLVDDGMPTEVVPESGLGKNDGYTKYTTYVLGAGAFRYADCGAEHPYEMDRNPVINGGKDMLYMRQRKIFSPYGISFTKASMAKLSPTDAELSTGTNWKVVNTDETSGATFLDHKAIPIARIITRG